MSKTDWLGVNAANPCPVCGKDSNCKVSVDGKAVWCGRVESARQNKGGQWFHLLEGAEGRSVFKPNGSSSHKAKIETGEEREIVILGEFSNYLKTSKVHPNWCSRYSIPQFVWRQLGAFGNSNSISVPERSLSDFESVTAIVTRIDTNRPGARWRAGKDHERGATFARMPDERSQAVLIVEGASDCGAVLAAGLEPIGRYTRDQDLEPFRHLLRKVQSDCSIVVVVERDKQDDEGQAKLFESACKRAEALATRLGRPVLVSSPPLGQKDFAAWWQFETNGKGHFTSERDRHSKGRKMFRHLVDHSREVLPDLDNLKAIYHSTADIAEENIDLGSEAIKSQSSIDGVDTGYQAEHSCAFFKSFHKLDSDGMIHKSTYLVTFLGCRCWKCWTCRRRIIKPSWKKHFYRLFASHPGELFRISFPTLSETKSAKKAISRKKGQFAVIQKQNGRTVVYASCLPRNLKGLKFDSRRFVDHYGQVMEELINDIEEADPEAAKPISVSRGWKLEPREKRGWRPIKSKVSPNQARAYAEELRAKTFEITTKATEPMQDAVGVEFYDSDEGRKKEELFKARIFPDA